jgi:predicted ArsR family transcriptional regulator
MVAMEEPPAQPPSRDTTRSGVGRLRILQLLQKAPNALGVQDLAEQVELHPNTVRFHLGRLVGDGLVQRHVEQRKTPGRPRLTYTATDARIDRRGYSLLANILASLMTDALPDAAGAAAGAGRTWGHYLTERPVPYTRTSEHEAVAVLLHMLYTMGFAPEPGAGKNSKEIHLRNCPFLEVAETNLQVVCAVHLGIMQGVLAELRSPVTANRLEPFVEPSLCVAHLGYSRRPRTRAS